MGRGGTACLPSCLEVGAAPRAVLVEFISGDGMMLAQRETGDRMIGWGNRKASRPRSQPSGPWFGYSGAGTGSGAQSSSHFRWRVAGGGRSAVCPLSSMQSSTQPSIQPSTQSSIQHSLCLFLSANRQPPTANRHHLSSITPSSHPQSSPASPPRAQSLLRRVSRRR